jgi:acyl-CoA synthetase (NDP forming)
VTDGVRDLRALFDPRSLAVVGASADPAKWGHWIARGALRGEHRRQVYLVNRAGGGLLGRTAHRSLAELPAAPELVVVAVPAAGLEASVDEALAAGARAVVVISAGLGELGGEGAERERRIVERVRAAGAVLLGPNCNGVFDAAAQLDLGFDGLAPGPVGLISQSGNLAYEVALLAADAGLGCSRVASVGNQADLAAADLVAAFAADPHTRVVAAYVEDFRDGRAFARAALDAARAGTPVVLLSAGRSEVAARAARSHTGALASDEAAVEAACRAAGIVRASTPKELVDAVQLLLASSRPAGRRLAVVADGGGTGVVAADVAVAAGLELPTLSEELRRRLAAGLPPTSVTANPVDLAGAGEQDFGSYERVVGGILASGEVDTVLLTGYLGGYGLQSDALDEPELGVARALVGASADAGRPLVCQLMYWDARPARALRAGGVPVYRDVEGAVGALARVTGAQSLALGVPELEPEPAATRPAGDDGYLAARELVESAGVPLARARAAGTAEEAVAAADALGYPVVLKALGLLHKSDAGGVVLGLPDAGAVAAAVGELEARLQPSGYVVEALVDGAAGVELIAGCRRDPRFGPLLLVGVGGVHAEVLKDTAVALAPATAEQAEALLRSLRGAALLDGHRGGPPVDVRAAAEAAAALSRLAAERPELVEVEVNPLLALPDGAIGLDARVVYADTEPRAGREQP